jgi:hypothetical protein
MNYSIVFGDEELGQHHYPCPECGKLYTNKFGYFDLASHRQRHHYAEEVEEQIARMVTEDSLGPCTFFLLPFYSISLKLAISFLLFCVV